MHCTKLGNFEISLGKWNIFFRENVFNFWNLYTFLYSQWANFSIKRIFSNSNNIPGGVNPFFKHIECCNFQTIPVMYIKVYIFRMEMSHTFMYKTVIIRKLQCAVFFTISGLTPSLMTCITRLSCGSIA